MRKVVYINKVDKLETETDWIKAVEKFGKCGFDTVLVDHDPDNTPERRAKAKEHARKVREAILKRKTAAAL